MQTIHRTALVPYTAQQIYDLVNDIEQYPDFIPYCSQGIIHEQKDAEMLASIVFGRGRLSYKLTTRNQLTPNQRICMVFVSGPLKRLHGEWCFDDQEGQTKITFQLQFELTAAMGFIKPLFLQLMNDMVKRFCQRARDVYGV